MHIKEIHGNETDQTDLPTFYDYVKAPADERKQYRTELLLLPFYQTKVIQKFIRLFAKVYRLGIAIARDSFYNFRNLFIGSTNDFKAADRRTYT